VSQAAPAAGRAHGFGTAPVFFTAISTILGAVLFLRFGYAVGSVGFLGTVSIIVLGHVVTLCTALALAEIATNRRVEGGGEYFIISRSFGIVPGAAIGLTLFASQAISVAFYIIAFAEAFGPVRDWLYATRGILIADPRFVSVPALLLLSALILTRGAGIGVRALYVVVAVLFAALGSFFLGGAIPGHTPPQGFSALLSRTSSPDPFFIVFAIVFPAFTGMTAGVGLSGDLRDPRRSIPLGTLAATVLGMLVYIAIAYKLTQSADPETLVTDQLVMQRIALWGPIIPIGLAAATVSSALGSILVAPRTLQAIAQDGVLPSAGLGRWLSTGRGAANEPVNATLVVVVIALAFVLVGNVDFVAKIISMFFMVTYGSLCLISFFEHMASNPEYRPSFRSRWYLSLLGALTCLWLMFRMSTGYALLSIVVMIAIYSFIRRHLSDRQDLSNIFQGLIFQLSRGLQVFLQRSTGSASEEVWRPSVVCLSAVTFENHAGFEMLRWIAHRYGFGTYLHYIHGYLSSSAMEHERAVMRRLLRLNASADSNVWVDTLISPSYTTAIAQAVQLPGVSGKANNTLLLEYFRDEPAHLKEIVDNFPLVVTAGLDVLILSISKRGFGYCRDIHIWIKPTEIENASMMVLLGYILIGHPDWERAQLRVFVIAEDRDDDPEVRDLLDRIQEGRLPISHRNIEVVSRRRGVDTKAIIRERSRDADLTIMGLQNRLLKHDGMNYLDGYEEMGEILFVHAARQIALGGDSESSRRDRSPAPNGSDGVPEDEEPDEMS
jgi:amino acid transporter